MEDLDSYRNELQQRPDLVGAKLLDLENLRQRQRTASESISTSKARTDTLPVALISSYCDI